MKKRGISPIIATVLLIAIVIVLVAIIFLWARGFLTEQVAKFDEPADRACGNVDFEAGINNQEILGINNVGNVPLYGFNVKVFGTGKIVVNDVFDGSTIVAGESREININTISQSYSRFLVVPVILGETGDGRTAYTCGDEFGVGVERISF